MKLSLRIKKKAVTTNLIVLIYFISIYLSISIVHYVCIGFFAIILLISLIKKRKIDSSYYTIWILVFSTFVIVSALWSNYLVVALNYGKGMFEFMIVGPVLYSYYINEEHIEEILGFFVLAGLILGVVLLIQIPFAQWNGRLANSKYAANANAVKFMESSLCAVGLHKLKENKSLYLALWFSFLILIILTGSRTMLVGTIIGGLIVFLFDVDKRHFIKPMILIITLLIGLCLLYKYIMSNSILYSAIGYRMRLLINSVFGTGRVYNSDLVRYQLIDEGLRLFKQRPIFGWGVFMFSRESASGMYYAHNNYVELLADFGLVGLIIFYSLFIIYSARALKLRMKGRNYYLSFSIAVIISFFVVDFGTVNWYHENAHILFMLFSAIVDKEMKKMRIDKKYGVNKYCYKG